MLYDQGQLANVYLDAFSITNDVFYSLVSRDILDYLRRDMIGPEGEIFSAEDADSAEHEGAKKKKEGAFYIWTSKEVYFLWRQPQFLFDRLFCSCFKCQIICLPNRLLFRIQHLGVHLVSDMQPLLCRCTTLLLRK